MAHTMLHTQWGALVCTAPVATAQYGQFVAVAGVARSVGHGECKFCGHVGLAASLPRAVAPHGESGWSTCLENCLPAQLARMA